MKTTFSFLLFTGILFVFSKDFHSAQVSTLVHHPLPEAAEHAYSQPVPENRWLMGYICRETELTYCCCDDGNSRVCALLAMAFICPVGGFIECTSDLRDCEGIEADCASCCPPCMA